MSCSPLHTALASLAALIVAPVVARAQTSPPPTGAPDPAGVVAQTLGTTRPLVRQSARHAAATPRDWTVRLATRPRECYELVGFAAGASRVTAEVRARQARVGEPLSLASGSGAAVQPFCAELPGQVYSVVVHTEGATRWALAVRPSRPESTTAIAPATNPGSSTGATPASTASVGGGADAGARADAGAAVAAAPPAPSFPAGGAETDFIANQIRAFARGRPGARAVVAASRSNLGTNQSREIALPLAAGRCVEIVAAGVPSVTDVDLELADPGGQRVAQDQQHSATESIRFCPAYTGTYRLTVRMFAGFGLTGVQAFEVR